MSGKSQIRDQRIGMALHAFGRLRNIDMISASERVEQPFGRIFFCRLVAGSTSTPAVSLMLEQLSVR